MNEKRIVVGMLALGLLLALAVGLVQAQGPRPQGPVVPAAALGTAFTYQGRLLDGGSRANGDYDFQFILYDAVSGGNQVGSTITVDDQPVSEGLFTVELDFGDVFDGTALWLEIGVRPGDSTGAYTILTPRQPLTAAPYALSLRAGAVISGTVAGGSGLAVNNNGTDSYGVYSYASATSGTTWGVLGQSDSTDGRGVSGVATASTGNTYGVTGRSDSTDGYGVYGVAPATSGVTRGVAGRSDSTDGRGVVGYASATTGPTRGVIGTSESADGYGVYGVTNATSGQTSGVYGRAASSEGYGVYGYASATSGINYGVYGQSESNAGRGVFGIAPSVGVSGRSTATSGTTYGLSGTSYSTAGRGVYGIATANSGTTYGVYGLADSPEGLGVHGQGGYVGVRGWAWATSGTTYGVYGRSDSTEGRGVYGVATAASGTTSGVYGESTSSTNGATGVVGRATTTNGSTFGIRGLNDSTSGVGVYGWAGAASGTNYGVVGASNSPSGYAGYFYGNVHVAGTLSKTGGSFKIDHPLDPANKYLYHSFVESPDMKNIYDGVVVLDENGTAWVDLPDWFEALNRDYRYQLTCIGGYAPVYIAHKIEDNRFQIAGGAPGMEVSWQVTGIRQDPWAQAHRIPVEVEKPAEERGTYLYPELYGQPEELRVDYQWTHGLPE